MLDYADAASMMLRIFALGTLKRGFPLHNVGLAGATYLGAYRTSAPYPVVIAGRWFAPMMFNEPGVGRNVLGELYEADQEALARLDALESVGQAGNGRALIQVESLNTGDCCMAFAYVKSRNLADPVHSDYLDDYQDRRFVPPWRREGTHGNR